MTADKPITQIDCGNGLIVTNPQIVADMLEWGDGGGSVVKIGPTGDDPVRGLTPAVMQPEFYTKLLTLTEAQLRQLVQRVYGNLGIDRPQLKPEQVEQELARLLLISEVLNEVTKAVESLDYQSLGTSLVYLTQAILTDGKFQVPVGGECENAFYQLLLDTFADDHPVFQYLQVDKPPLVSTEPVCSFAFNGPCDCGKGCDPTQEIQGDRQSKVAEESPRPEPSQDGVGAGPG